MKKLKLKTDKYVRRFAIGDIHGCYHTLKYLLEDELKITTNDFIVLLGDYIHKGPYSKEVIDYILDLQKDGYHIYTIRGNHEQNLIDKQKTYKPKFLRFITRIFTKPRKSILSEDGVLYWHHKEFFNELPYHIIIEDYHFVHAGFNFSAEKPKKDFDAMLTIRKPLPPIERINEVLKKKRLVHGHTPKFIYEVEKMVKEKRKIINLDSGCAYLKTPTTEQRKYHGYLSCLNLDSLELIKVKNKDQL
ncbi:MULTISPECIES: metallophosphoesterase family protein [Flammeovirga]|uniref:Serine/threonine protein phosphatase n=1 Tax=Flammeovirga agarivorans TaxID=2726742 RepID=A0A7X8SIF0_9BACT|nr:MULTISPECIES: metallophosphoesterase family protein [Flammeovirga]NLR90810.1 serine/threonine protein phosphatase [Flammeovirga agarivorans]